MQKQGCKSFRFGTACCEFICLDDTLSSVTHDKTDVNGGNTSDPSANYDLGLRLVASCITAVLSLSLLLYLIHRLRQRKIRGECLKKLYKNSKLSLKITKKFLCRISFYYALIDRQKLIIPVSVYMAGIMN